jgi:hypothetical protein
LTVTFTGAPPGTGMCNFSYRMQTSESATAVALTVQLTGGHQPHGDAACAAREFDRRIQAVLHRPLGDRVLLDAVTGEPMVVTE